MYIRSLMAGFLLLAVVGCGSGPVPLAAVSGRVTYRGTPLRHGSIVFVPDPHRGGGGPLARADIRADGTYELRTDQESGAVPGWHRITVVSAETRPANPGEAFAYPHSLLPARYGDPELSGLCREILAGRENRVDLELE